MGTPIPQPPELPLLGNAKDIDPHNLLVSQMRLADVYGPIYKLRIGGKERVTIGAYEFLNQICDEKHFQKELSGPLLQVRNGIGDGLFTAHNYEENWALAHRILMPAFGPLPIKDMFDEMHDIASQLLSKWARYGPDYRISVTDDFTRVTLDSIALCAMDTRFNSFYRETLHPFVDAMVFFLKESGNRTTRPEFLSNLLYRADTQKYWDSIKLMRDVADHVIHERRAHPSDKKDLVSSFLNGKDPKTGKTLSDENIANNMITFLIAGHETTSGLLSFMFVQLLKNPAAYKAVQKEVDEVVGRGPITYEHMGKIPYITACLRETLRLYPTAPAFSVASKDKDRPTFLGKDMYECPPGTIITALLPRIHRDPAVWGEDAENFKPERMLDENFNKLPPNSWKPFGNGMRGCIGRPFAWQEALLVTCMLFQNFDFVAEDPNYQLSYSQSLTIKPANFFIKAMLRPGIDAISLERGLYGAPTKKDLAAKDQKIEKMTTPGKPKKPMSVFFGSNAGTCQALASTLANAAAGYGYDASVSALDAGTNNVPKDQPVVVITASYEGQPPDNAAHFVEWLEGLKGSELAGRKYAVFGCGHRDWQATFQRIPILTDTLFEERGAQRLVARGLSDAADNDIFNDFDKWADNTFWPAIIKEYGGEAEADVEITGLDMEISTHIRSSDLRQDVSEAIVEDVKVLTAPGEPVKRHIQFKLPTDMTYRAGDYLAVLPINHAQIVRRVFKRFRLPWDARIHIKEGQNTVLPTGRDLGLYASLSAYVELSQPATVKQVATIAKTIPEEEMRDKLLAISKKDDCINTLKRASPLDLLETYPTAALPFSSFLSMLPPMRIRQYSISSSPLVDPATCTLTYSVFDTEKGGRRYLGIASNYLAELQKGDLVRVSVRPSHQAFHLPLDIANVPILMICAGSGLAPFRGFVQERAKQIEARRTIAAALLFVGCRSPDKDRLYAEEFAHWESIGAVKVYYAFSKDASASKGCKYVADRLWAEREEARALWDAGAKIFVCGSGAVGDGVRETIIKISLEGMKLRGDEKTEEEVRKWFTGIRNERFASDVFA